MKPGDLTPPRAAPKSAPVWEARISGLIGSTIAKQSMMQVHVECGGTYAAAIHQRLSPLPDAAFDPEATHARAGRVLRVGRSEAKGCAQK